MPFALVTIGLLMIVTGARNTHVCFARQLQSDFTGPPSQNFIWWIAALGAIGAIGASEKFRGVSRMLMALVIIVMVLAQSRNGGGGFFGQLYAALQKGPEKIDPAQCGGTADTTQSAAPKTDLKAPDLSGAIQQIPEWLSRAAPFFVP